MHPCVWNYHSGCNRMGPRLKQGASKENVAVNQSREEDRTLRIGKEEPSSKGHRGHPHSHTHIQGKTHWAPEGNRKGPEPSSYHQGA